MQRRAGNFVRFARTQLRWAVPGPCAFLIAVLWVWPMSAAALPHQASNPAPNPYAASTMPGKAAPRPGHARKRSALASAAQAAPVQPAAPPKPNWPVDKKPVDAIIVWDSRGLRIDAANSRLDQILTDISTDTGAKLDGLGHSDMRIFGTYGPGPADQVISQLLNGTGYNVLLIGDQGAGAPRQIVLSSEPTGAAPQNAARNSNDEDAEPEPMAPMAPMEQPSPVTGFAPPRTPQQIQEMQLRQEQIQQQLRQQNNSQQPTGTPDSPTPPQ